MMFSVTSTKGYDGLLIGNQPVVLAVFNIEDDVKGKKTSKHSRTPTL